MYRYFQKFAGVGSGNYIYFWKSKGLSDERISFVTTSNYIITPEYEIVFFLLKTSFIQSILVNINCISCLNKFLNSLFFSRKWTASTISTYKDYKYKVVLNTFQA